MSPLRCETGAGWGALEGACESSSENPILGLADVAEHCDFQHPGTRRRALDRINRLCATAAPRPVHPGRLDAIHQSELRLRAERQPDGLSDRWLFARAGRHGRGLESEPKAFSLLQTVAHAFLDRGDPDRAYPLIQRALAHAPDFSELPSPGRLETLVTYGVAWRKGISATEEAARRQRRQEEHNRQQREWLDWARRFVVWFEEERGEEAREAWREDGGPGLVPGKW